MLALAARFPNTLCTEITVSLESPAVLTWFTAKRVFPCEPFRIVTRHSSALEKPMVRFASACASSRESGVFSGSNRERGVMSSPSSRY